jgi:integrase
MNTEITVRPDINPAVISAVELWAEATTDAASDRRADLLRDKTHALTASAPRMGFFAHVGAWATPGHVTALDVKSWQSYLEHEGLSPASVYARISRLSSFFKWLLSETGFKEHVHYNPVDLARPKAPKAYQSDRTNALTDEEATALLAVVKTDADKAQWVDLAAKRDYAMLRFYFATGKRRAEIATLTWGDIKVNGGLIIHSKEKGGLYRQTQVDDPGVKRALFDYLKASGRWDAASDCPRLDPDSPLWLRHDRGAKGQPVTSHGFVKAVKRYAQRAGIPDFHLHQTRHTVARMVGELSGNMADVQTVLGHANQATTKVYLARVAIKQDKFSGRIADKLGLD